MSDYFMKCNINPDDKNTGDCTVRAISTALGQSWEKTFAGLCVKSLEMHEMPSTNRVWGAYLRDKGFARSAIPADLPEDYSVRDFCEDTPKGTFILACEGHVVAVIDGKYYDAWDSGDYVPLFYWERKGA